MRYISACSGIEAASVAWKHLGWQAVGYSEIEPFPCAVLAHHFPNTPNYGSLTEHQSWPVRPGAIDLLVGGTPCQSFSVAGLRKGLADPRGNLCLTFLGLADRLKPQWLVWENVPGVLSSNGGRDFGSFLGALVELGYGVAYRVLDAQHFGVPQRRRRVFVVACLGNWRAAAEVLSLGEGLRGYIEAGGKKRKGTPADAGSGVEAESGSILWSGSDQANAERVIDKAGTLNCDRGQREGYICPAGATPPLMFKVLGGVEVNDGSQGGIPGKSAGKGYLGSEDKAFTIATAPDQWLAQAYPINTMVLGGRPDPVNDARMTIGIGNDGDPQFTPQANHSHAVAIVQTAIPFRKSKRACSTTDNETWVDDGIANTLNNFDLGDTRTTHAVVQHHAPANVAPTVTSSGPPYSRTGNARVESEALAITAPAMAVRRLTPTECERLQGFSDNWTRIPWKGKPANQCPDGPRYKACGNSMAVPVMRWIGERIALVDATSA